MMNNKHDKDLQDFSLTKSEEDDVLKLAAVGMMPNDIAVALEMPLERRSLFNMLAIIPGTSINLLIAAGRANGIAMPQIKLQEAAKAGNIDAIKALQNLQARNRYNELVNHLDDDEFNP
jgi:hypothetical protein